MACLRNSLSIIASVLLLSALDSRAATPGAGLIVCEIDWALAMAVEPPAEDDPADEDPADKDESDDPDQSDEEDESAAEGEDAATEGDEPVTSTAPADEEPNDLEPGDGDDSSADADGTANPKDRPRSKTKSRQIPSSDLREFGHSFRRASWRAAPPDDEPEASDDSDDEEDEKDVEPPDGDADQDKDLAEQAPKRGAPEREAPTTREPTVSIFESAARSERSPPIRLTVDGSAILDVDGKIDMAQIANPDVADLLVPAPGRVIVVGRNPGATQLLLKIGAKYEVYHVSVIPDFSDLENLIRLVSPASDVHIGTLRGRIVLAGFVPDGETAQRIEQLATVHQGGAVVNHLTVAGVQQTLLRVTVAEVNKTALRSLGINWAVGGANLSRDFFLANNLGQLNPTNFGSNGLPDLTTGQLNYSVAPVGTGPNTNITFGFPRAELQFFLTALRENGLARALAEPNLVAISGQTASFLAGGEVPIPVSQGGATAGAITIQYKEFGVRLAFTPTVVGGQAIRLHVMTEVSEPVPQTGPGAGGLPLFAFNTRRVESTIECGSDQSFAIAGLLNEKINSIASKIPGVGDLPILGTLFSSVNYQKEQTELVVIVSPQMVEPLEPNQVPPPPGSLLTDPDDFELFALQKLEGDSAAGTGTAGTAGSERAAANRKGTNSMLVGQWGIEESDRPTFGP